MECLSAFTLITWFHRSEFLTTINSHDQIQNDILKSMETPKNHCGLCLKLQQPLVQIRFLA